VESNFGRYQKTHQTFGVLNSIIYYGEPNSSRTDWGKKHLVSFMKFHKNMGEDVGKDIFSIYSSYAGALGIPQFLPYNYERYAVDGNEDGKIDLFNSFADAAWSTVNLLKANGWFENKRRALYRWNRSTKFVNCILEYSEQLKEKTSEGVILEYLVPKNEPPVFNKNRGFLFSSRNYISNSPSLFKQLGGVQHPLIGFKLLIPSFLLPISGQQH